MEIRDVIHGSISIQPAELQIIDSPFFQRLRQIKQLGFAEYSYPSATHNRYIHSLGAMHTASRALDSIFGQSDNAFRKMSLRTERPGAFARFSAAVRLAALLHDIGHGPLSHTTEFAMPDVRALNVPGLELPEGKSRKATHEDYTLKMILDSELTPLIDRAGSPHGFRAIHVASLIEREMSSGDDFFSEHWGDGTVDFTPILRQLISSELDADRMDYLRRDSLHAGVSYGQFDFDWLVGNLSSEVRDGRCFLALQNRALYSFEDFLISRFHMFLMVYFHYKSVVFDAMLAQYFASPGCDYTLPAEIDRYLEANDAQLYAHLARSQDPWARRITEKRPYRMLMELHSGIPAGRTAALEQERLMEKTKADLKRQGIHYLVGTSTGELSKYFHKPADPIFVRYDNHYSAPSSIPVEQCTDLFEKYREKREITRLYVSPEDFVRCRGQGRQTPLRYDSGDPGTRP